MDSEIIFSVIMPTYNSEKTIGRALRSIRMQDLPQNEIEILVIDGGSTDRTIEIANKYNALIFYNPNRMPEYAKRIGFSKARGRWAVLQDSDEVLTEVSQLKRRKNFLLNNIKVYCMVMDKYIPGKKCGVACSYINIAGDPFSYVIYGMSNSRVDANRKYLKRSDETGNVYFYAKDDIVPIGDGGTLTVDIKKAKELFGEEYYSQEFAVSIFSRMVEYTGYVGCIPEDNIVHYSSAKFRNYLKKLRFRIYTNLNDIKQSGYSTRCKNNKVLRRRKYLFVLYVVSGIAPIIDSARMCVQFRRVELLLHFVYTYYVAFQLVLGIVRKALGVPRKEKSYGK